MSGFRLETERLVLRDWQDDDWPGFFEHTNTPAVMRWIGGKMGAKGRQKLCTRIEAYEAEHGHTFWAVERKADGGHLAGELLGFCGLKKSNLEPGPLGEFEIGWRLREDAWGKGYAREAAKASLRAGFEQFGAPEIIALTIAENASSRGLMERLGLRRRPELDFYSTGAIPTGEDVIVYSIDRGEWEARA